MGPSGKRKSDSDVEMMIRLRCEGWSIRKVARELGVNPKTVLRRAPLWLVNERLAERQVVVVVEQRIVDGTLAKILGGR